ncbi:glutathione peroxidase [Alteromonas sp. 5E99-2]|uniref:glutathione peroxidase n=1 Tax=Alteromonas sp. 5E99-2 TaxID=2817683 RepID=UPI001A98B6A7|nr:glutathione peroxidase [Alteromonas sp. 5E99-2]MBO1255530.1 glutathione peroxidase [Alteromonas sp. 5E99-2]
MPKTVYDFNATLSNGSELALSTFKDSALLIVNTASQCGFTPQYEGLEKMYNHYKEAPFSILAFPCNQFGNQEPNENQEIANFCTAKFRVSFPLFAKIEVNGKNAHPLYTHLKSGAPGVLGSERIKWNFTKFLVNKQGKVIKRFAPATQPNRLYQDIDTVLN